MFSVNVCPSVFDLSLAKSVSSDLIDVVYEVGYLLALYFEAKIEV